MKRILTAALVASGLAFAGGAASAFADPGYSRGDGVHRDGGFRDGGSRDRGFRDGGSGDGGFRDRGPRHFEDVGHRHRDWRRGHMKRHCFWDRVCWRNRWGERRCEVERVCRGSRW